MTREEAIQRFNGIINAMSISIAQSKFYPSKEELDELCDMAIEALSDRPHGEWIETSEGTMCGNCHKFPYDDGEYHIANWRSDFCPNCGADMRKEKA